MRLTILELAARCGLSGVVAAAMAGAACSHPSTATEPVHHGPAPVGPQVMQRLLAAGTVCRMPDASDVPEGGAWGVVCDSVTRGSLYGVTVVVDGKVAISSEAGVFYVPAAPGEHEITFYYGDCAIEAKVQVAAGPTSPVEQSFDMSRC